MVRIHHNGVIMNALASQITSVSIVYSTVCSGADQRKHQSSGSLAFVRGIHRWPVHSPHKGPVTRKLFPCDDVIMNFSDILVYLLNLLPPGKCGSHFTNTFFFQTHFTNHFLWNWSSSSATEPHWWLVLVWSHQSTSHFLNQCWPKSPTPYGVTRAQRVKYSYC